MVDITLECSYILDFKNLFSLKEEQKFIQWIWLLSLRLIIFPVERENIPDLN